MEHTIRFERRELVWETYRIDYTEEDWNRLVEYASHRTEDPVWSTRYYAIKDIDFNTLVRIAQGEIEEPTWTICYEDYRTYKEYLITFLTDEMRDDAISYGCIDTDYADDSEEELSVY